MTVMATSIADVDWSVHQQSLTMLTSARVRVSAATNLPSRAATSRLSPQLLRLCLLQEKFLPEDNAYPALHLELCHGELRVENKSPYTWVPLLPLAEHVDAETARLTFSATLNDKIEPTVICPQQEITLKLVLTRNISAGETPKLWFSSEVAAQLGLPFLNFSNIRGNEYACNKCQATFRAPNPLKLHLARACDTLAPDALWDRVLHHTSSILKVPTPWTLPVLLTSARDSPELPLSSVTPIQAASVGTSAHSYHNTDQLLEAMKKSDQKVSQSLKAIVQYNSLTQNESISSLGENGCIQESETKCSLPVNSYKSAFRPFSSVSSLPNATTSVSLLASIRSQLYFKEPTTSVLPPETNVISSPVIKTETTSQNSLPNVSVSSDPCADVETIVSSLGRGRNGHICLYCGKVYSRKYGLKIHIRTHTGYKPLSCRVCRRAFGDPSNLNKHVRLHAEGATPYRCRYCGKVLVRRRDLARHLSSRHPSLSKEAAVHQQEKASQVEGERTTSEDEEVEIEKVDS